MAQVTVPSLAKLNLDLRVLHRRSDGYHELRTVFQTVSLRDSIVIDFQPSRKRTVELLSSVEIPNNLIQQAAEMVMAELNLRGRVHVQLRKRIPMGAGLGGGSSNAAAILLALPALAKQRVSIGQLSQWGARLGSDVPFFLHGGTALGLGKGTELYPLPDLGSEHIVLVNPGVHVSTAEAYGLLQRSVTNALTSPDEFPILREFQAITWTLEALPLSRLPLANDFEKPVLNKHRKIASALRKMRRLGAAPARMTGSGSAIFGVFSTAALSKQAAVQFGAGAFAGRFVTRAQYRSLWRQALGDASRFCCLLPLR